MGNAIKCERCGTFQTGKRYDIVEFGTHAMNNPDDWEAWECYTICRKCKRIIKKFIETKGRN